MQIRSGNEKGENVRKRKNDMKKRAYRIQNNVKRRKQQERERIKRK